MNDPITTTQAVAWIATALFANGMGILTGWVLWGRKR